MKGTCVPFTAKTTLLRHGGPCILSVNYRVGFQGMADQLARTLRRGSRTGEGTTKLTGPVLMECIHIFAVLKHEQDVGGNPDSIGVPDIRLVVRLSAT